MLDLKVTHIISGNEYILHQFVVGGNGRTFGVCEEEGGCFILIPYEELQHVLAPKKLEKEILQG